jgi:hypothetical protein
MGGWCTTTFPAYLQVRVATGGVYRVALQPSCGARVVLAGADVVQLRGRRPFISIGSVPAEGVEGGADLLDRVAPRIVTVTVGDVT